MADASSKDQIAQLEAAIAAQEALRPTLGDNVVNATLAALRAQLETLRLQEIAGPRVGLSPEELLTRLQSYLPKGLAEKMRTTGRIEGERKQVTVLFADLSGFTALSERLDPEDVTRLTNEAFKEMAEAVYQYEGYIDKFVGDAIMAVFGAPVAHEDDPERALRVALAMRERLEGFNRRWSDQLEEPLALHIGINTGLVIAGNVGSDLRLSYTVMGDTVNIASRLEDAALPGQILVSRDTHRLTQEVFTFVVLEPITVKGKREPLSVFELRRARLNPGKARGLKGLTSTLVGREPELTLLRDVMRGLEAGEGRIVTLVGEAGLGKSRLMAEWRAEIGERAHWLEGRSFAHTTTLAYGPFLDLFRRYAGIKGEDSEAQSRDRLNAALEKVFPGDTEVKIIIANLLAMRLPPQEAELLAGFRAEVLRQRIFALIEEFFRRLAQDRPVLLVIEDLHWSDLTSIELIEHLFPLTMREAIAIIGIFRLHPDDAPNKLRTIAEEHYPDRLTRLSLAPLSETSSLQMVEQLLSTSNLPENLRTAIVGKAEGNPFFVEEVIRTLIERGALVRAEVGEGWVATPLIESVTVPDTLQGLLMARLDRLPDETKWVVQQASVIGRIFLYRVLLQMSGTSGLETDLNHLEREELIRERARHPEVEYIFKHALTQEVAYQSLLAPRRKELHCLVGQTMETIFADRLGEFYSIIATHFLKGGILDKAVDYLLQAGDAASRLHAHAEARLHYASAVEALAQLPDTEDNRRRRVDTIIKHVGAAFFSDGPEQNLARLSAAEALAKELPGPDGTPGGDRLRLARIQYWTGRCYYMRNEMREAVGQYRQVLAVAQDFGDPELVAIPAAFIGQVLVIQGQFAKAHALLTQALEPLEKTGNAMEWVRAMGYLGVSLSAAGKCVEGMAEGQRAVARAREINNITALALAQTYLSSNYLLSGELENMLESVRSMIEIAEQSGDTMVVYVGYGYRGWAQARLGDYQAAFASREQSKAVGEKLGGRLILTDWFGAVDSEIALAAGRFEDAIALAEKTITIAKQGGGIFAEGLAERSWGAALAAQSQWAAAEAHLTASVQALEAGQCLMEAARTHLVWGHVSYHRGNPAAARSHLEKAAAQFQAAGRTRELEQTQNLMLKLSAYSEASS